MTVTPAEAALILQRLTAEVASVCPGAVAASITWDDPPRAELRLPTSATDQQRGSAHAALAQFDWVLAKDAAWVAGVHVGRVQDIRKRRKTADEAFASNAFADVADLQIPLAPNTHYDFEFEGAYTAAAATTGLQLSVSGPASPTFIRFVGQIAESVTAVRNAAGGAYDAPIAGAASGGATALPFRLRGSISTGAAGGLFKLRARTEVNGSAATVLRGSIVKVSAVQ